MDTMTDLLAAFKTDMQRRKLSNTTISGYNNILKNYNKFLQSRNVEPQAVTRQDLKAYLDLLIDQDLSYKTVSCRFGAISNFYDFLVFEEMLSANPVRAVQKRYLQTYKNQHGHTHQLISVEQAAALVEELADIRDKALLTLLFKTGIRRKELIAIDVTDIDFENQSIVLKPTPKRSNRTVFFDDEAEGYLKRWLRVREARNLKKSPALFISAQGRLKAHGIDMVLRNAAVKLGLHDCNSEDMEKHFSAHCCRHWLTTHLDRAGMKRNHIQVLRGDVGNEAIDIYIHNDMEKIRKEYLACVPRLSA